MSRDRTIGYLCKCYVREQLVIYLMSRDRTIGYLCKCHVTEQLVIYLNIM